VPDDVWALSTSLDDVPVEPDEPILLRAGRATALRHHDWLRLDERRREVRDDWASWFADVDVLLCPAMAVPAFPHQVDDDPLGVINRTLDVGGVATSHGELTYWAGVIGVAYLPSVVVPVGFAADGMPVGVQVVADHGQDRKALAVAAQLEEVFGGFTAPPGYGA